MQRYACGTDTSRSSTTLQPACGLTVQQAWDVLWACMYVCMCVCVCSGVLVLVSVGRMWSFRWSTVRSWWVRWVALHAHSRWASLAGCTQQPQGLHDRCINTMDAPTLCTRPQCTMLVVLQSCMVSRVAAWHVAEEQGRAVREWHPRGQDTSEHRHQWQQLL